MSDYDDSDDSSVKPDVCEIVKKPLPTTAHSSGAKIVEAGGYSNVYLNHQGTTVSANKVLDGAMKSLERLLNQKVACDVACGLVNILTTRSSATEGESTLEYHQFAIEFEDLNENLFKILCSVTTVVNPTKVGNAFHFYGRSRKVFFEVLNACSDAIMKDLSIEKLSLQDLLDSTFAQKGLDG